MVTAGETTPPDLTLWTEWLQKIAKDNNVTLNQAFEIGKIRLKLNKNFKDWLPGGRLCLALDELMKGVKHEK